MTQDGPCHVSDNLATLVITAAVSIIIPTYRECENIPHILQRIDDLRRRYDITLEVIFADDDSQDGSVAAVEASGFDWARIIVRKKEPGLSQAVVEGFRAARHPVLVCMDCDLSHPPEAIPQMIAMLSAGHQFVLGSRYVPGAGTDDDWGFLRWFNSVIATLLARPLTKIRDPMSGFFALRKSDFDRISDINPVGYKIALELIVKGAFDNVGEVPIFFTDRQYGESKLTLRQQLLYIKHLRRLYIHQFAQSMYLLQFLVVGASGVLVNLAMVTLLGWSGLRAEICLAGGILVSIVTNFLLNRRFTFSDARDGNIGTQFFGFIGLSLVAATINYFVALTSYKAALETVPFGLQVSALIGIASGMTLNYLGSRYLVFRKRYTRRP